MMRADAISRIMHSLELLGIECTFGIGQIPSNEDGIAALDEMCYHPATYCLQVDLYLRPKIIFPTMYALTATHQMSTCQADLSQAGQSVAATGSRQTTRTARPGRFACALLLISCQQ
jgi:hypothetical protein